jgi:di/tricarboxylate transporter
MWLVFAVIGVAVLAYASERLPIEHISFAVIVVLLLVFHLAPVDVAGQTVDSRRLLAGFAEPALVSVLCLLVMGQGLVRTGALDGLADMLTSGSRRQALVITVLALAAVLLLSAFINNTPVVVIFIPVVAALAGQLGSAASRLMMPLSFAAILGGSMTLMGSSTNLLAAGAARAAGQPAIGFFDFVVPGAVLAGVGLVYVIAVLPRLLPDRETYKEDYVGAGRQFIAQVRVLPGGPLEGQRPVAGMFPTLPDMTVRLIQRGGHAELPPFEDLTLVADDIVVVAATRQALTDALAVQPGLLVEGFDASDAEEPMLAEVMVSPGSRLIGRNLRQIGFHFHTGCVVLGVQRRSSMLRSAMDDIRLDAGDVLLVHGAREKVRALRGSHEVLLMEWSAREMPLRQRASRAVLIFAAVVAAAATGLLPVVIAAMIGAGAMVAAGCLNVFQAFRAIDPRVVFLVAAALAMGTAMNATGGAGYLGHGLVSVALDMGPAMVLSLLFALVAVLTNLLSNNATAVLFTPIAIGAAQYMDVPVAPFVHAVILAANCSFATPIGYQTNLLVMGPGHYRFRDFLRGGLPLVALLWIVFSLFAPWYYDL